MRNDPLSVQSMDFAVSIINLVKTLKEKHETIISNQIGRSGTSIGANIREAQYAHGTADFVAKLQIALKEANETGYWLELLYKTDYISAFCIFMIVSFLLYRRYKHLFFFIIHPPESQVFFSYFRRKLYDRSFCFTRFSCRNNLQ